MAPIEKMSVAAIEVNIVSQMLFCTSVSVAASNNEIGLVEMNIPTNGAIMKSNNKPPRKLKIREILSILFTISWWVFIVWAYEN
jgi:archaellum biogenesis protein FlaJ (TadC family)